MKILCKPYFFRYDKGLLKSATKRSNIIYGGLNIKESRVVYVHGSIDPWHALGITISNSTSAPAIYIEGELLHVFYFLFWLKYTIKYTQICSSCLYSFTIKYLMRII